MAFMPFTNSSESQNSKPQKILNLLHFTDFTAHKKLIGLNTDDDKKDSSRKQKLAHDLQ